MKSAGMAGMADTRVRTTTSLELSVFRLTSKGASVQNLRIISHSLVQ